MEEAAPSVSGSSRTGDSSPLAVVAAGTPAGGNPSVPGPSAGSWSQGSSCSEEIMDS